MKQETNWDQEIDVKMTLKQLYSIFLHLGIGTDEIIHEAIVREEEMNLLGFNIELSSSDFNLYSDYLKFKQEFQEAFKECTFEKTKEKRYRVSYKNLGIDQFVEYHDLDDAVLLYKSIIASTEITEEKLEKVMIETKKSLKEQK